jgi:hypothetical protein
MKGSAKAKTVIAAPVDAEERWTEVQWMDDLFEIDMSFPVPGVEGL